ncbi:MAG TPA: GWxTD domain-containing protein [Acidobacteriota bacterium]|nr:GWxTD domain-containing protein [Acidobacteriota bacterium]
MAQDQDRRQEEAQDYYRKWLEEDVVYIISEDEKAVFLDLGTPEEKDQFIEQFWRRRDPSPQTIENEFKTEHYRRISYVNERYFSGEPGWKTDRGMIYIKYGEPDSVERQPFGGPYRRRNSEGGGETTVLPWERWWYRHIPGVGEDVEIEFVDKGFSNDYKISLNPNDKDAFLYVAGHGTTREERLGNYTRFDRVSAPLGVVDRSDPHILRNDLPFQRLRRFAQLSKPAEFENPRLKEIVDSAVHYEQLPFQFRSDWLRAGNQALVPLTVSIDHQDLRFGTDGQGSQARVNVFGRVKSLQGRIVSIFEDSIVQDRSPSSEGLVEGRSLYQKMLLLNPGRYRLDLVLEDVHANRVGTLQTGLIIPSLEEGKLAASPVILVDRVEPVAQDFDPSQPPEMFVLGTLKVLPHVGEKVAEKRHVMFYFQLYNAALDGSTNLPSLDLTYQLLQNGQVVDEKRDADGGRASYISGQRIAFLEYLSLRDATSDSLQLKIEVKDRISGQTLSLSQPVRIAAAPSGESE